MLKIHHALSAIVSKMLAVAKAICVDNFTHRHFCSAAKNPLWVTKLTEKMSTLKQKRKHLSCCLPELKEEIAHLPSNEIERILNKFLTLAEPVTEEFDPSALPKHKNAMFKGGL